MSANRPLRIGYLYGHQHTNLQRQSATALHIRAVIDGLQQRGHRVRFVSFREGVVHWTDDWQEWHPVAARPFAAPVRPLRSLIQGAQRRLQLPYFNFFDSLLLADIYERALADFIPDVLYERFWLQSYGGQVAARRLSIPHIFEVNGDLVEEYHQLNITLSRLQWWTLHQVTRQMYQRADQVIPVSETLKAQLLSRYRLTGTHFTAVENGAHVERFAQPDPEALAARRAALRPNGEPVIMFVGSFKPWHGLDLLLEAFAQVPAAPFLAARLVLVGDGPTRTQLEAQAVQLGIADRVHFAGVVAHPEVPAFLANADIAILNPRVSGASQSQSPLKLYEYMGAGAAVIAPDIPNVRRVLAHRRTGYIIQPNDAGALSAAMHSLLANPDLCRQMGRAAQQQALTRHSWAHTVAEIEKIMIALQPAGDTPQGLPRQVAL